MKVFPEILSSVSSEEFKILIDIECRVTNAEDSLSSYIINQTAGLLIEVNIGMLINERKI